MVFHLRWIFLTTNLWIPPDDEGGIRRLMVRNPSCGKPYKMHFLTYFTHFASLGTLIKLNTLCKVADHENHVRWMYLTTILCMGEGHKYTRIHHPTSVRNTSVLESIILLILDTLYRFIIYHVTFVIQSLPHWNLSCHSCF